MKIIKTYSPQIKSNITHKQESKKTNSIQDNFITNEQSNYSVDNLKANYLVSFKGYIKGEVSSENNIGTLIYETRFFREPKTDEIVQDYILKNFSDWLEVNIVSGACSIGEEAKSYAMMLDSLGDKLHIYGFDISDNIIKQAKGDNVRLLINADSPVQITNVDSEKFITDEDCTLTPYLQKCKEKFTDYFDKVGTTYKEPIFPDAQKELDDLNEMLQDEEKYKKAKNEFDKKMNECMKSIISALNNNSEVIDGLNDCFFMSFEKSISMSKKLLKQQTGCYYTYQDYKAKDGTFKNCHFKQGDILKLEELYKPNSINVLLYRNALYHTLCEGNGPYRYSCIDAQEKMDIIAKQMNKVVVQNGLVVFGEDEWSQGINYEIIKTSMENSGFKKLIKNENDVDNIWIKVKNID